MIYFFLLSLFYISTTTRHTLENRRFLEANSNEKFCGTIRETLCECAAPSSMESYIYNIACPCVSHICRVYVSVCISMCLHVCGCVYVRVSVYYDTLSLSLPYLLSYFLTFVLSHASFRSFLSFSRSFSPAHSRFFRHMYTRTRFLRPPFSPSLSYFLTFHVRSSLSMYRFSYFYETQLDSEEGNYARPNENHKRFSFNPAS